MKKLLLISILISAASAQTTVPINGTASFSGTVDASAATRTAPVKVGTTAPATCTVGDFFYDSDATVGQNIYSCTSTNTWTLEGGGVAGDNAIPAYATDSSGGGFTLTPCSCDYIQIKRFATGVTPVLADYTAGAWVLIRPMRPMGAWSAATTYKTDQRVTYAGSTYRSYANGNINHAPYSQSGDWELVVGKGTGPITLDDTSSSTTAYTATVTQANEAYDGGGTCFDDYEICVGQTATLVVNNANSGTTPTITINSLAAKTIVQYDGTAVIAGQIPAGTASSIWWDGTNWRLSTPLRKASVVIPAATCQAAAAATGFSLPSSNAPTATCHVGTNTNYATLDFADSATQTAEDVLAIPSNVLKTDVVVEVYTSATTGNSVPQFKYLCTGAGDNPDGSWSTAATVTVAASGTASRPAYGTFSSAVPASCAGKTLHYQILRDPTHASDTIATTLSLVSVMFNYSSVQ